MGGEVATLIGVFLLSAVKFGIGGVPAAVFADYSFFKTIMVTSSGGIFGVFFFSFFSEWVNNKLKAFNARKEKKTKKKFTLSNKIIVYTKKYFGLLGIAIVTPLFLSIPLGVFLSIRYYKNKQKVISYMIISILGWAVVLYYFYHSFAHLI